MTPTTDTTPEQSRPGRMLKIDDVIAETSLSRSAIYRAIAAGTFPKGHPISAKRVAWSEREIDAWKERRFPFPN